MEKKTFFILSLAIMLLGSNRNQIQAQANFVIPANSYNLSSTVGTFTDISDDPATVKLGANLPDTNLQNGFFVNAVPADPTAAANFVTHGADSTKTDPGFPLGFTFNLCGKKMTHFTICASGGIHFSEKNSVLQGVSSAWKPAWNAEKDNYINLISTAIRNGSTLVYPRNMAGKTPVMYRIAEEDGQQVLTVQYDYAVQGDEWIYQIKAYENGNIKFVAKALQTAHATNGQYRFFLALVENGGQAARPQATIKNDLFSSSALNIVDATHYLGFTHGEQADWDIVSPYTSNTTLGGTPAAGLYVTASQPESGRTVTMTIPEACPQKAASFKDEWYSFNTTAITATSVTAQITFDKTKITPAELTAAGTLVAVLSTSGTPDYSLDNGTYYTLGSQPSGNSRVVFNAKPTYYVSSDGNSFNTLNALNLTIDNLPPATRYYLHIYAMDYKCTGAPVYSDLCRTFSFSTSFDLPALSAGIPSTTGVPLTVKSGADNLGVILFKSPNTSALSLDGKPAIGDKVPSTNGQTEAEAEVIAVIDGPAQTPVNLALEAGEGCYVLAYSVRDWNTDQPVYAQDFVSLPVRAAYNGLPVTLNFDNETARYAQSGYPDLPCGWSREIELDADHQPFAFGTTRDEFNDRIYLQSSYNYEESKNQWMDVITPAFVPHRKMVQATFFISATENVQGELEPQPHEFTSKDQIRLEYAVKAGNGWQDWQEVVLLSGGSDHFPKVDANGYYPIPGTIENLQEDDMIRLRYSYKMPAAGMVHNRIHRVELIEGRECATPVSLRPVDSLTTATSLTLQWQDDDLQQAPYFIVTYGPAGTDEAQWHSQRVRRAEATGYTLRDLDRGTAYAAKVAALCGTEDTSFYTQAITTRTALVPPYRESMAITESGETPFERGVQALSGNFGGPLTEAPSGWNQTTTSAANATPVRTVAVGDFTANAWLTLPPVYIRPDAVVPMSFSFLMSSFDDDKQKGVAPQRPGLQLQVLVSDNGRFYSQNSVLTISGESLAANDSVVTVDLTGRTGCLYVALLFVSPNAEKTEYADLAPWYLEVSDCRLAFDVDVCFPVENLKRRLLVGEVPLTWDASPSAVEYGVFWGDEKAEGYSDSVFVKENSYTITKFAGDFRHKAMVIAYCSEDRSLKSDPATTSFTPNLPDAPCPTPTDFHYLHLEAQSVDLVSSVEPNAGVTGRLVYLWETGADGEARIFAQAHDTLPLHGVLNPQTAYAATTRAVCASDTSGMSDELQFTTPEKAQDTSANETIAQLSALFSLSSQNGEIFIRNQQQLQVETVTVFNLSGQLLHEFRANTRDDLHLPVAETRRMLFVRIRTEQGTCVHKLYHR